MNSIELTRLGIILTMTSVLFISPEIFYRARELSWISNILKRIESLILNIRSFSITSITESYIPEVKLQLEKALKTGKFTKLLLRVASAHLIPLISLISLILYFCGYLHLSVGIIAGILIAFYFLMGIIDVSVAHKIDKKRGKDSAFVIKGIEHLKVPPTVIKIIEYIDVPPTFVLFMCFQGVLWFIVIIAILSSSKSVRSWLAIIGIILFFTGQALQLVATFS